jgi:hypothetical protein
MGHDRVAIRTPSPHLRQWDENAGETACTAQLLYMHGKLDDSFSRRKFDRQVGRKRNQPDLMCGNLRVLLEEGFEALQISPDDLRRIATDYDYVRAAWLSDGLSETDVDEYLPGEYPDIRNRALRKLELIDRYKARYTRQLGTADWSDVSGLLRDGYLVVCTVMRPAAAHDVLVTSQVGRDTFQVYNPACGLRDTVPFKISESAVGYRLAAGNVAA